MVPPPLKGGVPQPVQLPISNFHLVEIGSLKDLAKLSFVDIRRAKWLSKYGPAVTAKLMQSLAPPSIGQYTSHWCSVNDWIVKSNQSDRSSALLLKYLDFWFLSKGSSDNPPRDHLTSYQSSFRGHDWINFRSTRWTSVFRACFSFEATSQSAWTAAVIGISVTLT